MSCPGLPLVRPASRPLATALLSAGWRAGLLLVIVLVGLPRPLFAARAPGDAPGPVSYVLLISVDGLRGDAIERLGPDVLPNFYRMRAEGAFTDNARADNDLTITLPNHTSQLTGRRVETEAGHNWTENDVPAPDQTLHSNKGAYVASMFDVAHDHGLHTAAYASKQKFVLYDQSYDDANGAPDVTGEDNGRDKIDRYVFAWTTDLLVEQFEADLTERPHHLTFFHYYDTDAAGHASGWDLHPGSPYRDAIVHMDYLLGRLLDDITAHPVLRGRTVVLLTADHGGNGTDHSWTQNPDNYTIPFYVWGAGVPGGADLYDLNPSSRQNPGMAKIDFDDPHQPIRNGDAANLALSLLGLPPVPGSTINASADLTVRSATPVVPAEVTLAFQDGVSPTAGYAGTRDTKLRSGFPRSTFGTALDIEIDGSPDDAGLVRWDVSAIPPGSTIHSAEMTIDVVNPTGHTYELYEMRRSWSEMEANWTHFRSGLAWERNGAAGARDRGDAVVATVTAPQHGARAIPLNPAGLALVERWVNQPSTNQGLIFQSYTIPNDGLGFSAREVSSPSRRPRLTVTFTPPAGNIPPQVQLDATALEGTAPLEVVFSSAGSSDRDGTIVRYAWDFGTGEEGQASGPEARYTFDQAGTYVVTLVVTDNDGASARASVDVVVTDPAVAQLAFQDGVAPSAGYDGTRAARMRDDAPTTALGDSPVLEVDGHPDAGALLRWDVSAIPAGATVVEAEITLDITDVSTHAYHFYGLRRSWVEEEATWFSRHTGSRWQQAGARGSADRFPDVLGTILGTEDGPQTIRLNEAGVALVQAWIDDPAVNLGLLVANYDGAYDGLRFSGRHASDPAVRPRLTITYTPAGTRPAAGRLAAPTAVEGEEVPAAFELASVYPNPFNPTTTLALRLAEAGAYEVSVYSALGQRVYRQAFDAAAGGYSLPLDLSGHASGAYLVQVRHLTTGGAVNGKLLLLK